MLALGIDPDLHTTGIAVVESLPQSYHLRWVGTARVGDEHKRNAAVGPMAQAMSKILTVLRAKHFVSFNCIVVEGQQFYGGASRSSPADLICLAQAAGAAAGVTAPIFPDSKILMPLPPKWTGGIPKEIRHARLASKVIGFDICRNEHERDAVGLAVWGLSRFALGSLESRSAGAT